MAFHVSEFPLSSIDGDDVEPLPPRQRNSTSSQEVQYVESKFRPMLFGLSLAAHLLYDNSNPTRFAVSERAKSYSPVIGEFRTSALLV